MALAIQSPGTALEDSLFGSYRAGPYERQHQLLQVDDGPLSFRHLPPEPDKRKVHGWTTAYQFKPLPAHKAAAGLGNFPFRAPAGTRVNRRRAAAHARQRFATEVAEGQAHAGNSAVRLPSDHQSQPYRCPSLLRQGAFRADGNGGFDQGRNGADDEDNDTAELYRLGLLYDDEHERGPGFGLDKIVHREPAPEYTVREAKRVKRNPTGPSSGKAVEHSFFGDYLYGQSSTPVLSPLTLSFNGLANDDAIARFLISPDNDFGLDDNDSTAGLVSDDVSGDSLTVEADAQTSAMTSSTATMGRMLAVIYEADEPAAEDEAEAEPEAEPAEAATQLPTAPTTPADTTAARAKENDFSLGSLDADSDVDGATLNNTNDAVEDYKTDSDLRADEGDEHDEDDEDEDDDDWDAVDEADDEDLTITQPAPAVSAASVSAAAADAWVVVLGDDS